MKTKFFKAVILLSISFLSTVYLKAQMIFPGADWATATPEEQGIDPAKLDAAIDYLASQYASYGGVSQMVIIRNGYMIHNGGNIDLKHGTWSTSKSFASTVLGHLIDRGMCGLSDLAKDYVSALAAQYPNVTLRHFATMTSGYDGAGTSSGYSDDYNSATGVGDGSLTPLVPAAPVFAPGTMFSYFDDAMHMNGYVITKIAGASLEDYFRTYIARPIGIPDASWEWNYAWEGSWYQPDFSNPDGVDVKSAAAGVQITARQLARLGHLYLNRGNWDGTQIISSSWVGQATSVQVPNTMTGRTDTPRQQAISASGIGRYGYNWWVNGVGTNGQKLMPDVPGTVFLASGYNSNYCFVIPDWNIVITRLGTSGSPENSMGVVWNNFLKLVGESINQSGTTAEITGELKKWHRITLTFDGPSTSEAATPNPFTDYRLNVTFTKGTKSYTVPGFYAADGDAGETSVTSGNKWRVYFTPDETGTWNYTASFRTGTDIAVNNDPNAGTATSFNGDNGQFTIGASDKTGRDFRGKGLLKYVNKHYLQFADTGEYFIKGGADSPENFLAYQDFDGTSDLDGTFLHTYSPHSGDWQTGDPAWKGTKGKNSIGALNYLSGKGMNSVYFLTMNVGGDGNDVWPWTSSSEHYRFDCSKLDQWETVFSHMDRKGIMMHVVTQEEEIDQLLDGGALGVERKLYYRELIARFGHHLAVVWNLGEENTNTDQQRKDFCKYLHDLDPYDHPVVAHTFTQRSDYDGVYTPLLGYQYFEGASLQVDVIDTHSETLNWVTKSAANGRKWIVCLDEIGPYENGVLPDANDPNHDSVRKNHLWANLMAGGAGCEWYFGYNYPNDDLDCEDWRSRDKMWDQTNIALEFFRQHLPFYDMSCSDSLTSSTADFCLAKKGEVYAVYLPNGGTTDINLETYANTFQVKWYNPRTGGSLQAGTVSSITGPGNKSIGNPPGSTTSDWGALIGEASITPPPPQTEAFIEEDGRVVFEAENYDDIIQGTTGGETRDWELQSYIAGYAGSGFMKILPDTRKVDTDPITTANFYDGTSPESQPLCELTWNVNITMTGRYMIWFRCFSGDSEDNGVHFGLDNASTVESRRGQTCTHGSWHWSRGRRYDPDDECGTSHYISVVINTAGNHTFHAWMREDGFKLDKVVLLHESKTMSWGITAVGPVESPRGGAPTDTTPPSAPASVRDGTGGDIGSTTLTTQLSANWDSSTDNESGISGYSYAIGSSPGATDITNWTSLGNLTAVTKTGTFAVGQTYYFSVKAVSAGGESAASNSDGQTVEASQSNNLALGKAAAASSLEDTIYAAGNAVDGNTGTRWSSLETGLEWIYVDLGSTYNVNRVVLKWEEAYASSYEIQVSANAVDWAQAYATTSGNGGTDDISFSAVSARYVRMYGTQRGTPYCYSLWEFEVYGNTETQDTTPPAGPAIIRDGAIIGSDDSSTYSTTGLSANWPAATDAQSSISGYQYAVGSTPAGTNVAGWTAIGNVLTVTKTGLSLALGTTYYFSVRAINGQGLTGTAVNSNGQYVKAVIPGDTTPPAAISAVRDGVYLNMDISKTDTTTELSANWNATIDAESGVEKYWYAIGTTAGGSNVAAWTDNSQLTNVTRTGLNLVIGATYYFSVKGENSLGLQSSTTTSNGQYISEEPSPVVEIEITNVQIVITANSVTITWVTNVPATSQVEYWTNPANKKLTVVNTNLGTSHSVVLTGLTGNTQYQYRVISGDSGGDTATSSDSVFSTTIRSGGIIAYPNPCDFKGGKTMSFAANGGGEARIYTVMGKLVKKLRADSGTGLATWDGTNESGEKVIRGIYIYRITQNNGRTITGKLAVTR